MAIEHIGGVKFADNFRRREPVLPIISDLSRGSFVASRVKHVSVDQELTEVPPEDTFVISFLLTPFHNSQLWLDNRPTPWPAVNAGELHVYDLAERICCDMREPVEFLYLYMPKPDLAEFAHEHGLSAIGANPFRSGFGFDDAILARLAGFALAAVSAGASADQLAVDEMAVHLQTRFIHRFSAQGPVKHLSRRPGPLAGAKSQRITRSAFNGVHLREHPRHGMRPFPCAPYRGVPPRDGPYAPSMAIRPPGRMRQGALDRLLPSVGRHRSEERFCSSGALHEGVSSAGRPAPGRLAERVERLARASRTGDGALTAIA